MKNLLHQLIGLLILQLILSIVSEPKSQTHVIFQYISFLTIDLILWFAWIKQNAQKNS
jgi:nicotinamide riboside transporter PnuC